MYEPPQMRLYIGLYMCFTNVVAPIHTSLNKALVHIHAFLTNFTCIYMRAESKIKKCKEYYLKSKCYSNILVPNSTLKFFWVHGTIHREHFVHCQDTSQECHECKHYQYMIQDKHECNTIKI